MFVGGTVGAGTVGLASGGRVASGVGGAAVGVSTAGVAVAAGCVAVGAGVSVATGVISPQADSKIKPKSIISESAVKARPLFKGLERYKLLNPFITRVL